MENDKPLLLHIETATEVCSAALTFGDEVLAVQESGDGNSHSKNLLPYIDQVCKAANRDLRAVDGVVVSVGPGSYTGLRIGVSTAKGIAYSLGVPVMAVSTLASLAAGAKSLCPEFQGDIVPMIDARRMEVFTARYNTDLQLMDETAAVIVEKDTYTALLDDKKLLFCGNGMPKCKDILSKHANAHFVDFTLSARFMLSIALKKWKDKDFADTAYFEPFYLKEYVAGKPNVKGLH